ncbi:antirepressor [Salmonella phage 41]|nr:antirepressor [Salmonella phage 41]
MRESTEGQSAYAKSSGCAYAVQLSKITMPKYLEPAEDLQLASLYRKVRKQEEPNFADPPAVYRRKLDQ